MEKRLTMFLACLFLSLGMALAQNKEPWFLPMMESLLLAPQY